MREQGREGRRSPAWRPASRPAWRRGLALALTLVGAVGCGTDPVGSTPVGPTPVEPGPAAVAGGIADTTPLPAADLVPVPTVAPSLAVGRGHHCLLRVDGVVVCWPLGGVSGTPWTRRAGVGHFTRLGAGSSLSGRACAVRSDGAVECWPLDAPAGPSSVVPGSFTDVAAGPGHACALHADGRIRCWGANGHGQAPLLWAPTLPNPSGSFVQVAVGAQHSCALRSDGGVECVGLDDVGQAPPVRWSSDPDWKYVTLAAEASRNCGVLASGSANCWGGGASVGIFDAFDVSRRRLLAMRPGVGDTCSLHEGGVVACWGVQRRASPEIGLPGEGAFGALSVGDRHGCGLRGDAIVECWQLGDISGGRRVLDGRAPQSIGPLDGEPPAAFGVGPAFTVAPTATSGLPVALQSATPAVCAVAGTVVTVLAGDTCTLVADQTGGGGWLAAPRVTRSYPLHLVWIGGLARVYDGTPKPVDVSATPATAWRVEYEGQTAPPTLPGSYRVRARVTTSPAAPRYGGANGTLVIEMPRLAVQPARVSLSTTAQVTVYVYGSDVVDATAVVPANVRLRVEGSAAPGAPVATRSGAPMTSVRDFDGDGKLDRQLVFLRTALQAAGLAAGTPRLVLEDRTAGSYRFLANAPTPTEVVP